jgi:hypothetical protein
MDYKGLAIAIIVQAVEDYRFAKEFHMEAELEEVEGFFNSDWCDQLLFNMRLTGRDILAFLERE